jgi:tetratricopeptide (TPR) repeat protein
MSYRAHIHRNLWVFFLATFQIFFFGCLKVRAADPRADAALKQAVIDTNEKKFDKAQELFEEALWLCKNSVDRLQEGEILHRQGQCYIKQGRLDDAERTLRHSYFLLGLKHHPDYDSNRKKKLDVYFWEDFSDPKAAAVMVDRATVARLKGNRALAGQFLTLSERLRKAPPVDPTILAEWHKKMDGAASLRRASEEASILRLREALKIAERFGPNSARLATNWRMLGDFCLYRPNDHESLDAYKHALAIYESVLGVDHPALASLLDICAAACCNNKQYTMAESMYKRELQIFEGQVPDYDCDIINVLTRMVSLYETEKNWDKEIDMRKRLLAAYKGDDVHWHSDFQTGAQALAKLYVQRGKPQDAEPLLQEVLKQGEDGIRHYPENNIYLLSYLTDLANVETQLKKWSTAEALYKRAIQISEEHEENEYSIAPILYRYSEMLRANGRSAEASALEVRVKKSGYDPRRSAYY